MRVKIRDGRFHNMEEPGAFDKSMLDFHPEQGIKKRPTRVLLADDHTMFREGLAGLLTS